MNMVKKTAILLMLAISFNALLLAIVWAHRLFVTGLNPFLALLGLLLFLLIATPLMVLAIKWLIKSYKGNLMVSPATIFLLGFFIFLIGDFVSELIFGSSTLDFQLHDTYFVIAHAHVMIFFALIFLAFSAVYFFYPRISGRTMNAPMGYIHFGIALVGAYLLYWPVQYTGLAGMPRRYIDYSNWVSIDRFRDVNVFKMKAIILLTCAQFLFLVNLIYSAIKGEKWRRPTRTAHPS
jgi:cytochrome c oxidase subunit 1